MRWCVAFRRVGPCLAVVQAAAAIGVALSGVAMGVPSCAVAANGVGATRLAQSRVAIANRPAIE